MQNLDGPDILERMNGFRLVIYLLISGMSLQSMDYLIWILDYGRTKLCIVLVLVIMLIAGIIAVLDAWQDRDRAILRVANAEFRKLGAEEKKVMVMAIKDDDR